MEYEADTNKGCKYDPIPFFEAFLHLASDYHVIQNGYVKLYIQNQKTSKTYGTVSLILPSPLAHTYLIWVEKSRRLLISERDGADHDFVFIGKPTCRPFKSNSFSTYCRIAFEAITGQKLNLQLMRRLFASGSAAVLIFVMSVHHFQQPIYQRIMNPNIGNGWQEPCLQVSQL